MEPLTEKQEKILKYIESCLQRSGPPSQREIADHFGMAQNSVYQLISYLKKKGYILIDKTQTSEEDLFAVAIDAGAEDIKTGDKNFEI